MHQTELDAYRELFLSSKQLQRHWGLLAELLDHGACMDALHFGAHRTAALLRELEQLAAQTGIPVGPATLGTGRLVASLRSRFQDPFLERNRAIRLAALDLDHIIMLTNYLFALAQNRNASQEIELMERWQPRLLELREQLRLAVVELAADPDEAARPMNPSAAGKLGHRVGELLNEYSKRADRRWG